MSLLRFLSAQIDPKYNSLQYDISRHREFYNLTDYALHYWMTHIQKCEKASINEKIIERLVSANAIVNASSLRESTALHTAVKTKQLETVDLLLNPGARYEHRSFGGFTPLHFAAHQGYLAIMIRLLKEDRKQMNCPADLGTPLPHPVSWERHCDIVDFLLQQGDNSNLTDFLGNTPCRRGLRPLSAIMFKSNIISTILALTTLPSTLADGCCPNFIQFVGHNFGGLEIILNDENLGTWPASRICITEEILPSISTLPDDAFWLASCTNGLFT
jgi:hypothetical protein